MISMFNEWYEKDNGILFVEMEQSWIISKLPGRGSTTSFLLLNINIKKYTLPGKCTQLYHMQSFFTVPPRYALYYYPVQLPPQECPFQS
jgi:hypothetical protein